MSNIMIQLWTENTAANNNSNAHNGHYLMWYTIISLNVGTFVFVRLTVVYIANYLMVKKLHKGMVSRLIYASINNFFDRIPIGRILNRLSKDLT